MRCVHYPNCHLIFSCHVCISNHNTRHIKLIDAFIVGKNIMQHHDFIKPCYLSMQYLFSYLRLPLNIEHHFLTNLLHVNLNQQT